MKNTSNLKKTARLRRAKKTRMRIEAQQKPRISVYRSLQHMYAQLIVGNKVKAGVSTQEKTIKEAVKSTGNVEAAALVGKAIAEKAKSLSIKIVAFDRSGYAYHGRVKALAEAARESGLDF